MWNVHKQQKITVFQTLHFLLPREVLLVLKCERSLLILQVIDYIIYNFLLDKCGIFS